MASHNASHPTPLQRLLALLAEDRSDLIVLLAYTVFSGLLGLVTPLAVQALVNNIAAGFSLQPLVVLSTLLAVGLVLVGGLALAQLSLVESIQQRLFARLALRMARRLIASRAGALHGTYGPELANRFFDILTIQKSMAKVLLEGTGAALQALVGLALLAFYDLRLFGLDIVMALIFAAVIWPLGIGGLRTSQAESARKYAVAGWLEELARCHGSFKVHGAPAFLMRRADDVVLAWLGDRRRHFQVTFRQEAGSRVFQAVAGAGVLAVGGFLVVQQEITLGELVATQLIVAQLLKATEKLLAMAEVVYDLLTGLDKTSYVTDLEEERAGGEVLPPSPSGGAGIVCRNLNFAYPGHSPILTGLSLELAPGERVSLVGESGVGKSTLASLLCGLEEPDDGYIAINGVDIRAVDLDSLRQSVTVVGFGDAIFDGTLAENVVIGRTGLNSEDLRRALAMAQFEDDLARLPDGVHTRLVAGGRNLSRGQIQRLLIARAIVDRPELLILDEAFTGMDERTALKVLDAIFAPENPWTIIDISHDPAVVLRARTVHVLEEGRIVESGPPEALAGRGDSAFARLFPHLVHSADGRPQ